MPEMNLAANFEPTVEKWSFKISAIVLGSEITTPTDSIHDKGEKRFARGDFVECFPKFGRVATVFLNEIPKIISFAFPKLLVHRQLEFPKFFPHGRRV